MQGQVPGGVIRGVIVDAVCQPVLTQAAGVSQQVRCTRVVQADHQASVRGDPLDKSFKSRHKISFGWEAVWMVVLDICDHRDRWGETPEHMIILVGFDDKQVIVPCGGIHTQVLNLAADDEARFLIQGMQHPGDHRGGSCLSMAASDTDDEFFCQQRFQILRPVHNRDTGMLCGDHFHIIVRHSRRPHHQIRTPHVIRIMPNIHLRAG